MATSYCTVANLKVQIEKTTAGSDAVLTSIIEAASRAIDNFCGREAGWFVAQAAATARLYSGSGGPVQRIDECMAVTLVEVKDSPTDSTYDTWAATDYILATGDPRQPNFNKTPYTLLIVDPTGDETHFTSGAYSHVRGFRPLESWGSRGVPTVRITAKWGYATTCPPEIEQACIIQSAQNFKRAQSSWARTVGSADMGIIAYPRDLDPAVKTILVDGGFCRVSLG